MKKRTRSIFLLLAIAGAFVAGSWYGQSGTVMAPVAGVQETLQRVDLAHSAHAANPPGIATDSAMPGLVHVHGAHERAAGDSGSAPPGTVSVSLEQQQLIGVRVSAVEEASSTHTLRLFGRVAADETRIYKLNAGVEGFVREVAPVTTGSQVKKDQWLATFSAPESRSPIQSFLVTLDVLDRGKRGGAEAPAQLNAANASTQLAIDRLLNLGMSGIQIEEIRRTREATLNIRILAPAAGFVLSRNLSPGQKFEKGAEWFRIADLKRVWIVADVFENDAQYLQPGARAQVSLPNQETGLGAKVSEVLPQFDAATRTLKVRLEADNPGYLLRPEMLVDVALPVNLPAAIAVPVDAVLDSGLKKTVFVEQSAGRFEPREVQTGWRFGERVEIVQGLTPGERIATSGTFFLDSESRMKLAAEGKSGADPIRSAIQAVPAADAHAGHAHGGHH